MDQVKNELNQTIAGYGRRIIIFIDDIDRLEKENIRLLFRLIRLNADFSNTTYVLSLDRDNTERTLSGIQDASNDSGRKYLEKIVQVGFDLPPASPALLEDLFFQELNKVLSVVSQNDLDKESLQELYLNALRHLIKTPRDIIRYINGLRLNLSQLMGEVNIVDFIGLEALRTFSPDVFTFIRDNKDILAPKSSILSSTRTENIKQFLEERFKKLNVANNSPISRIFSFLFPDFVSIVGAMSYKMLYMDYRKGKRICSPEYINRYFYLSVSKGEVTESEMQTILTIANDKLTFCKRVQKIIENGQFRRFLEQLEDHLEEISEESIPFVISCLFDLGDQYHFKRSQMFEIDERLHIARIAWLLLKNNPDTEKRTQIAKDVASSCNGLSTLVQWISVIVPKEKEEVATSLSDEDLLEPDEYKELCNIAIDRIRSEAKQVILSKRYELGMLLFRWRDWANIKEPQDYVVELIKSDEGLLDFLVGLTNDVLSSGGGHSVKRIPTINWDSITQLIDPNSLEERVNYIKTVKREQLSQEQKEAVDAFFRRGKTHS